MDKVTSKFHKKMVKFQKRQKKELAQIRQDLEFNFSDVDTICKNAGLTHNAYQKLQESKK